MEAMSLTGTDMYASKDTERQDKPRKGKQAAEQRNFKSERGRARPSRTIEHLSDLSSDSGWAVTEALSWPCLVLAAKTAVPAEER